MTHRTYRMTNVVVWSLKAWTEFSPWSLWECQFFLLGSGYVLIVPSYREHDLEPVAYWCSSLTWRVITTWLWNACRMNVVWEFGVRIRSSNLFSRMSCWDVLFNSWRRCEMGHPICKRLFSTRFIMVCYYTALDFPGIRATRRFRIVLVLTEAIRLNLKKKT